MIADDSVPPGTIGLVLHKAALYDFTVWLMTLGQERVFREKVVHLARLKAGESVLDVGCGTGTLAIAAKRHVGRSGTVHGIDASPEMLARARKKAKRDGLDVVFRQAAAQALPYPDGQFDAVLSTVTFHHLPRPAREQCAREMRRVLKPGGRALVVDFAVSGGKKGYGMHHPHRHGHVKPDDIATIMRLAELEISDNGAVGFRYMQFVLGIRTT
jgi:ubiquinone/menaquinone biosynthesis C-methylase UbiE